MISFIMMAKNEEARICDAISILVDIHYDWELIVVDDHSVDGTFEMVKKKYGNIKNIKLLKNPYEGKVLGTNYAFTLTCGDYIKCIDADDVLRMEYFNEFDGSPGFDVYCHDFYVTDDNLKIIGSYYLNKSFFSQSYKYVLENLISLPKATWTISREIANKVFPIPHDMPIEDLWISVVIKKHAKKICYTKSKLYYYRQHSGQDYGGLLNYKLEYVLLRAARSLKFIKLIETNQDYLLGDINFNEIKAYLDLILGRESQSKIFFAKLRFLLKVKIILMLYFPSLAICATKVKWGFDSLRSGKL